MQKNIFALFVNDAEQKVRIVYKNGSDRFKPAVLDEFEIDLDDANSYDAGINTVYTRVPTLFASSFYTHQSFIGWSLLLTGNWFPTNNSSFFLLGHHFTTNEPFNFELFLFNEDNLFSVSELQTRQL